MDRTERFIAYTLAAVALVMTMAVNRLIGERDAVRRLSTVFLKAALRPTRTEAWSQLSTWKVYDVNTPDTPVSPAFIVEPRTLVVTFEGPDQVYVGLAPSYAGHRVVLANRGPGGVGFLAPGGVGFLAPGALPGALPDAVGFLAPGSLPDAINYDCWLGAGGWTGAYYDGTRWVFEGTP